MNFLIITIICVIFIIILKYIFSYNIKKIKALQKNEELDEISKKYPNNIEICKKYLDMLNNKNVKIEENKESDSSFYIAISNKISIGNISKSYSRIQTIAHECLHSIQDRKILIFNFIFSNIYLLYYFIILGLNIFGVIYNQEIYLTILIVLGLIYYMVRMYLENDAMIKSRYLAKEYLEKEKISSNNEIEQLVKGFDEINDIGIKFVNYNFLLGILIQISIYSIISFIR